MAKKQTKAEWVAQAIANPLPDICIPWPFAIPDGNHATVTFEGVKQSPHRVAYKLHYGHFPEPQGIRTCENQLCLNPLHVKAVTTFGNGALRAGKRNNKFEWMKQRLAAILPDKDACELWPHYLDPEGYGRVWVPPLNRVMLVHHAAFYVIHGRLPKDKLLHRCDTPACFLVKHLFEGSQIDNIADMNQKGRQVAPRGERQGSAKLTADDVRAIRLRYASGEKQTVLAASFGVDQGSISAIVLRKSWKHVV